MKKSEILWPCDLSGTVKNMLMESARIYKLNAGEHLQIGRDADNGLCYIIKGMVVLDSLNLLRQAPWMMFVPGDWFGGSYIHTRSRTIRFQFNVSCLDHAEILCIPEQALADLSSRYEEIYKLLYMVTRERANEITEMLFASTGLNLCQKVAHFLQSISSKFPHAAGTTPMISISQSLLAQVLGISRSKLNRELHLLKEKKIIAIERMHIYILDAQPLEAMIAGA